MHCDDYHCNCYEYYYCYYDCQYFYYYYYYKHYCNCYYYYYCYSYCDEVIAKAPKWNPDVMRQLKSIGFPLGNVHGHEIRAARKLRQLQRSRLPDD